VPTSELSYKSADGTKIVAYRIDGVVLTGTAAIDLLESALDLDQPIDLAMFNAPFLPARTDYDWLSRDEVIVDAYVADPRCGFRDRHGFGPGHVHRRAAGRGPGPGRRDQAGPAGLHRRRRGRPGQRRPDPADPADRAVRSGPAGLADVTVRTYPDARHEILNETNRDEVIAELNRWLDRVVDGPGQRG
jgi:alpha-beta hydrolase superfamily lysophospholipase